MKPSGLTLAETEARLAEATDDPVERARRLIDYAERAPVFRYRQGPARDALVEASRLLRGQGQPELEARCLLRLAAVQLDDQPQGALQGAEEAARRFQSSGDETRRAECLCLQSRALRRLGKKDEADARLVEAASLQAPGDEAVANQTVAFMLALADQQTDASDPAVIPLLRRLLNLLDGARLEAFDARYQAHMQLALALRLEGKADGGLKHLRAVVSLIKQHDAPSDLLEARLALGTALAAAHETAEARRVLQVVIDQARDLGNEELRLLGLTGMIGVLADDGAVQGAVATAIQSAAGYAKRGDLLGYVRGVTLAVQVLLRGGHEVPAVEMLMYGVAALEQTMGEDAARLLQMQLDALRETWGEDKYEAVCRKLLEVRAARRRLSHPND